MARRPATEEDRARERRRIRRAAAAIHRESGISAVTVRAIAERAGISTGKIYSYFGNLQDLMRSLWAEPVATLNERFESIAATTQDPVDRIAALLGAYLDFARSNDETYRGAFLFVRPTALTPPEQRPASDVPFLRLLALAIREGQEQGSIRTGDPERLAALAWAGLHGAIALPINADLYRIDEDRELGGEMIDLLLSAAAPERTEETSS